MQDSRGHRAGGIAPLLLRSCYIYVLFPFGFPNERKALIWCSEHDKGQKHSLTFPSETRVVSVSKAASKHLSGVQSQPPAQWVFSMVTTLSHNPPGDLSILSKGTPDASCWVWGHLGNGKTGLPPLAPLNSVSDNKSSNHREQMFSGSQKSDTWKSKKETDKYTFWLNWPKQEWDENPTPSTLETACRLLISSFLLFFIVPRDHEERQLGWFPSKMPCSRWG